MADQIMYKIKIKVGNNEIEFEGDKEWVEKKLKEYQYAIDQSQSQHDTSPPSPTPTKPPSTGLPDSISNLFQLKGSPKTHNDKAVIIAYWLEKNDGLSSYNFEDISDGYSKALLTKPANITDAMNQNQKKGYFINTGKKDGKKAWRLSLSGVEYVEQMK